MKKTVLSLLLSLACACGIAFSAGAVNAPAQQTPRAAAETEALTDEFKQYQSQIVKNAAVLADALKKNGIELVSDGTDNHLMLLKLTNFGITGKELEHRLDEVHITANKNTIPNDPNSPFVTSGIRLGTPAMTTRGFKEEDMKEVGKIIAETVKISDTKDEAKIKELRARSLKLCEKYPLY